MVRRLWQGTHVGGGTRQGTAQGGGSGGTHDGGEGPLQGTLRGETSPTTKVDGTEDCAFSVVGGFVQLERVGYIYVVYVNASFFREHRRNCTGGDWFHNRRTKGQGTERCVEKRFSKGQRRAWQGFLRKLHNGRLISQWARKGRGTEICVERSFPQGQRMAGQ